MPILKNTIRYLKFPFLLIAISQLYNKFLPWFTVKTLLLFISTCSDNGSLAV